MFRGAAPVVVIGAGPYGLSTAAHLKARGVSVPEVERARGAGRLPAGRRIPRRAFLGGGGAGGVRGGGQWLDGLAHVPEPLVPLLAEGLASRSSHHSDLGRFAGREVLVVGAGQSAQEGAALLHEAGVKVELLVCAPELVFGSGPGSAPHWQPDTPLGRSWAAVRGGPPRGRLPAAAARGEVAARAQGARSGRGGVAEAAP
ncbi:FAD-dependent monooxygenase [Streptomyces sp. NPDC050844]|uniref:FAD-dependent monooxygenase n=1 Tax=Streptomyces sp. NPDC050844 TaxID=3155790 RepID=UPI0033F591B9